MQPYQERVIAEQAELAYRLTKLSAFISKGVPAFEALDNEDQRLMRRQREVMLEYHEILGDRIARFKVTA